MTCKKKWDPRVFDTLIDPIGPDYNATMKKPNHKLLPHDDYNISGEYIGVAQPHQFEDIPNAKIDDIPDTNIDFWLSEAEYAHNESVS